MGGDRLICEHETTADPVDLMLIKLFFNGTLSKPNANFISADIKDFSLANNPLLSPEFMRIHIRFVPKEIIDRYKLRSLLHNDWLYLKISKDIYVSKAGVSPRLIIYHANYLITTDDVFLRS